MTETPDAPDSDVHALETPSTDPPTEILPRINLSDDLEDRQDLGSVEPTEGLPIFEDVWESGPYRPRAPAHNAIRVAQEVSLAGRRPARRPGRWWLPAARRVGRALRVSDHARRRTRAELVHRAQRPLVGDHRIAVVSLKGGVGKTTVAASVGSMLALHRGDRVIAVDAGPDFGTLAFRGPNDNAAGVMDLLADDAIERYSDVRKYTSQTESRLDVLASQRNPAECEPFSADGYTQLIDILHRYYNIVVTDCGAGLAHPVMKSVLDEADVLVLVTSAVLDGASSAAAALDWLSCHGYGYLADRATVVINVSRPGVTPMDTDQLAGFFRSRVRAAHVIPYDEHLAEGGEVALPLMSKETYDGVLELAASLADVFPTDASGNGHPRGASGRELTGRQYVDGDTIGSERRWT